MAALRSKRRGARRGVAGRLLTVERLEARNLLSLTHLYTFNDGLANDWVGSAHAQLLNGASIVGGQLVLSNAGVASGQTSLIQHAKLPTNILPAAGSATIEVWFTTGDAANWAHIFDIGEKVGADGNNYLFYSPLSSFGDSQAILRPAASSERTASGPAANDSVQHMAAVVADTLEDVLRLYLDGAEAATTPLEGATAASVNDVLAYLGRSLFDADPGFTGSINELRVYDEARTAGQVAEDAVTGPAALAKSPLFRQMEYLNRGVVAVPHSASAAYVGWRMFGTDPANIAFNLYRSADGGAPVKLNASPLVQTTDFVDSTANLTQTNEYFVRPALDGVELAPSESFTLIGNAPVRQYLDVPLQVPSGGTVQLPPGTQTPPSGTLNYTYNANDASVGDLDGDGQYEIILKWDPSNSQDNANEGLTGNVLVDAYRLDGTRLWRIDLGRNIRAGAHYTQFLVYDFDGDGRSEVVIKTADGTIDGAGQVIGNAAADYRDGYAGTGDGRWGRVLAGPEFLTVFDGLTGAAQSTINFSPPRGNINSWGDNYGNRGDRFLAAVAYLDGVRPSIVMARGYYAKTRLTAYDWRNGQLTERWAFDSTTSGNSAYGGQGNHNLSVADVDADGKDEIIYGAAAFDDNGLGLHSTGFGHGDALHVSDMDPARPGLEVWQIHEAAGEPGADFRDARTGQTIFSTTINTGEGPGRGVAADVWAGNPGYEMWGAGGLRDVHGNNIGRAPSTTNFLVWWDADPVRELLDGQSSGNGEPRIDKYGTSADTRLLTLTGTRTNNGTKATPSLSADILGDWREEVVVRTANNASLRIYTTVTPSTMRLYTLMHDPQYRSAITWQNVAYNQPPHPGFFLGAGMSAPPTPQIYIASTTAPLEADFNGDRRVDAIDLAAWQRAFGETALVGPISGDADGDLRVEGGDFLAWQRNFGADATSALTAAAALSVDAEPHDDALTSLAFVSLRTQPVSNARPLRPATELDLQSEHSTHVHRREQPLSPFAEPTEPRRADPLSLVDSSTQWTPRWSAMRLSRT